MNPYRKPPGAPARIPSRLRKTTLLAFGLGLTAGVALGPLAAVLALRGAAASVPVVTSVAVPIPVDVPPEQVNPTTPDPPEKQADPPAPAQSRLTADQARATIASQADRVMKALAARDTTALAAMLDEDQGLELNPFSQGSDLPVLTPSEVRGCLQDRRLRDWGDRGGDGETATLTCADYWKKYLGGVSLGAPSDVTYNELHQSSPDADSHLVVATDDIFVRYFFAHTDRASDVITLVFTTRGRAWKLIEIAREGAEKAEQDCDAP
jgi:hypothetical protein